MNNTSLLRFLLLLAIVGGAVYFVAATMWTDPNPPTSVETENPEIEPTTEKSPLPPEISTPDVDDNQSRTAAVTRVASTDRPVTNRGGSALSGTVSNQDGQPVANAEVELLVGTSTLAINLPAARKPTGQKTLTDADGSYTLDGLAPSKNYVVRVRHVDYAQKEQAGLALGDEDYQLVPDIRLDHGAKVHGSVTSNGTPLVDATVELWNTMGNSFIPLDERLPFTETKTDPQGVFEFLNVHFNSFEVVAKKDGYANMSKNSTTLFTPLADTEMNFDLESALTIAGVVLDASGRGVPNARIDAYQIGRPPNEGASKADTLSGSDGRFALDNLSKGTYNLSIRAKNFSDKQHGAAEAGDVNIRISLEPRGAVAGNVQTRTGSSPGPITVRVMRSHAGGEPVATGNQGSFSSANGAFELGDIDPGQYVVEASAEGFAPTRSELFNVERGATTGGVFVTLSLGASMTGRVVSRDGTGAKGAIITIRQNKYVANPILDLFQGMNPSRTEDPTTRTSSDGSFRINNLVPGTVQLEVSGNGYSSLSINDVVLTENQTYDVGQLMVSTGGKIVGRCLDPSNRPYGDGSVNCVGPEGGMASARLDLNGNFEFGSLPPGEYTLTLNPDKIGNAAIDPFMRVVYGQRTEQKVTVNNDRTHEVTMRLPPPQ